MLLALGSVAGHRRSGNCGLCGTFRETLHKDHVIPKWAGGVDDNSNWQYICANCHEDKTRRENSSPEFKAIVAARHKGHKWTDAQRTAHSARQLGKPRGSYKNKGRPLSLEHRAKVAAAWQTPEARERVRQWMSGKKFGKRSPEVCAKIKAALKGKLCRKRKPEPDAAP